MSESTQVYDSSTHNTTVKPSNYFPEFDSQISAFKDEWWMKVQGYVIKLDGFNKPDPYPIFAYPDGVIFPSIEFMAKLSGTVTGLSAVTLNEKDNKKASTDTKSNKYWKLVTIQTTVGDKEIWQPTDLFLKLLEEPLIKVSKIDSFDSPYFNRDWLNSLGSDVSKHIQIIAYHEARNAKLNTPSSKRNYMEAWMAFDAGFVNELSFMNRNFVWYKENDRDATADKVTAISNNDNYLAQRNIK